MLTQILLVAHIAVLGYWLGAEFVINSTYRYVCFKTQVPLAERDRLMGHVMNVDQHVRYALVLQATLGTMLAALYGFVPGGETTVWTAAIVGAAWLAFVETIHHVRHGALGQRLAAVDRWSRYLLLAVLLAIAIGLVGGDWAAPLWLRIKLGCFAGVIASGVGIRIALISHFRTWAQMMREGATDASNAVIRRTYFQATGVLLVLWAFIAAMVVLSVWKPG